MSENKVVEEVLVKGYRKILSAENNDGIDLYFVVILIDGEFKTGHSTRRPYIGNYMVAQIDNSEEPKAEYILY